MRPDDAIDGCRDAHRRLLDTVQGLDERTVRGPSVLADWTVGHLLTHLARNADGCTRLLEGAMRDEVLDMYVGGMSGRVADIEAGAGRAAAELLADVRATSERLEAAIAAMPAEAWGRSGRPVRGGPVLASSVPLMRWREVEIHLVDLGIGFTPADWSPAFVTHELPDALEKLPRLAEPAALLAWVTGRGPVPELAPW